MFSAMFRPAVRNLRTRGQYLYWKQHCKQGSKLLSTTQFTSEYDYVICGAGSAGCVLANRLSASPSNNVLLLEAGPSDAGAVSIHMPSGRSFLLKPGSKFNWYYNNVPQKHLNDRRIYCPRGKVLGGTSAMNGMIYMRGHAYDYDRWESEGAKGWSYADCLPYFKKSQNHELGPNDYRGSGGPLQVTRGTFQSPLFEAFLEAGQQAGHAFTDDVNGYQQEGVGAFDMTIYKGKRCSAATAFLNPVKKRKHLHVQTKALVTRILFDGTKAVGVEYEKDGQIHKVRANKEVIVSGGTINSPQLLMLSGIGDADELKQHGIPVVCHLPGVGKNHQDHLAVHLRQVCKKPVTVWSERMPLFVLSTGLKWLLFKKGPGISSHLEAGGFLRSHDEVSHPDIQIHFGPMAIIDHGRQLPDRHIYTVQLTILRPESKGTIKLQSANPRDHPIIDSNFMSAEKDWKVMRAAVKLGREIMKQKAFDDFRGDYVNPEIHSEDNKVIDEFIRHNAETVYHNCSTCKMGDPADSMAVVDHKARVFGTEGLRVVDASIMPSLVSGNTNAPAIMIAEKAADHILGNPMLPKEHVSVYETEMRKKI